MPVHPQLMVLYTNDAVEVRYSDGSRLHILPCGTSFTYSQPRDNAHPAIGMEMITQRCAFVTSTYRNMLLSALDFRNRFAERPFLCEDLCEMDQVVHLYARIKEIAWPKICSPEHCEIQEDGGVCITSVDEFGSLILSPHRRDFTICYLSLTSQEKTRERKHCRKRNKDTVKDVNYSEEYTCKTNDKKAVSNKLDAHASSAKMSDNYGSEMKWNEGLCSSSHKKNSKDKEDLNISPITQASFVDSPRAMSNASGSPVTPHDTVKDRDAMFRPFSTPTEGLDEESPNCTQYGETAVFHDYPRNKGNNSVRFAQGDGKDGSFLDTVFKPISEKSCDKVDRAERIEKKSKGNNFDEHRINRDEFLCHQSNSGQRVVDHTLTSHDSYDNSNASSTSESTTESKTRYRYTWLTRHISCDECPVGLNSIVKMATEAATNGVQSSDDGKETGLKMKTRQTDTSKLRQINRKSCHMSELPPSLPLSCPGQHLHKTQHKQSFDDGKNPLEDPTTFSQGRLKVLLIDGIVYRIVRLPTINVVEIYPGDGSVLVSQGMSAHFFLHVIPHGSQLEERTYSIKSPPPAAKGSYSVKNLMNRAHRFLGYIRQEETTLPASVGLCCWKHEEFAITEPSSTSVLEECTIQGYGKFTALSNGQIRVAFADRTCLDMTCDLSQRISKSCDQTTSSGTVQTSPEILADKKADTCRLLLPNGQYQMVNVKHPGVYKRYIDIAKEWTEWVNSSPSQRIKFYHDKADRNMNMSVERELQKIQCFNYIVDNTLLKKSSTDTHKWQDGSSNSDQAPRPSILRTSDQNKHKNYQNNNEQSQRSVHIHSPPSMNSRTSGTSLQSSIVSHDARTHLIGSSSSIPYDRPNPIGQSSTISSYSTCSSRKPISSSFEGFNSVREALMRTSNVIKDIDQILERK